MSAMPLENTPSPETDDSGRPVRDDIAPCRSSCSISAGRQAGVKPFLFNLFNDKAIIGLPHRSVFSSRS
ncbi:MAG: hypothetical protein R3C30_04210 [Hyphomonadaceae bacterium]